MRRTPIALVLLIPLACASPETSRESADNATTPPAAPEVQDPPRTAAAEDEPVEAVGSSAAETTRQLLPTPGPDEPPVLAALDPWFTAPPLSEALAAWEHDNRRAAIDAFQQFAASRADDPRAIPARFYAAWLMAEEDDKAAIPLFERLADEWPLMADIALVRAAELIASSGSEDAREAALATLDRIPADSIHKGRALALRSELLGRSPEGRAAAKKALEEAVALVPEHLPVESWLELIALRAKAGDEDATNEARLEVAIRFARDEAGREVMGELAIGRLTPAQRLRLGRALFNAYRHRAMRRVIGRLNAPKEIACEAWLLLGRAAERRKRKDDDALEKAFGYYEKALDCTGEVRAWATFLGGRARLPSKRREGRKLLRLHADEFPDRSTADDALLLLAQSEKGSSRTTRALMATLKKYPRGDMADAVAWGIVGPHVEARNWNKVLETTGKILEITPDDVDGRHPGRYRYWRGRALWELDDQDAARAEWRRVFQDNPLSWYSLLAFSRLSADGGTDTLVPETADAVGPPDLRVSAGLWREVHFRRALEWARLSGSNYDRPSPFLEMVERELDAVPAESRPEGDAWTWTRIEVEQLGGGYPSSMRQARRLEAARDLSFPVGAAARPWKLAYPRPYSDYVTHWASERELDPFWIWAVMRVESNFDPRAVSWAEAIGLMQIIMSTARGLVRDTDHKATRENLMRPAIAVELGTKFLRSLLKRHKVLPLASAGYNAGGGSVSKWRRQFGDVEIDEFVERIPFPEAHSYTKSVSQTWARYRWLYGGEIPTLDLQPVGPP